MKFFLCGWPVLLITIFSSTAALPAAEAAEPGILFLQLRLKDGTFSLVSATNVPGMLKAPRGAKPAKEFQLVVEVAEGKPVWTEEIADPSVERLEYEDPAKPGGIQVKEVRRAEVEFTVRVPAGSGQRTLAIYRRPASGTNVVQNAVPSRELVSRIELPILSKP